MKALNIKYTQEQIDQKRREVAELFMNVSKNIKSPDITCISSLDIMSLFWFYDTVFLDFWFDENFKGKFKFSLSKRMTKSAGMTVCPKNAVSIPPEDVEIEIKISSDMVLSYEKGGEGVEVAGIKPENSLQALQLVLEHEIIHAAEFIMYGKSSCKGERFKTMANNIFGHTESTHSLKNSSKIACENIGIKPGSIVEFYFEGKVLSGMVYKINKKLTVIVEDKNGRWQSSNGKRYAKYYVPLGAVKVVK